MPSVLTSADILPYAALPRNRRAYWVRAAAIWVRLSGLLAVALALKTVLIEGIASEELLWAAFWATGIAVGAAIIALFAVFEKRRNEAAKQVDSRSHGR